MICVPLICNLYKLYNKSFIDSAKVYDSYKAILKAYKQFFWVFW